MYTDGFFEDDRTDNFACQADDIVGIVAAFMRTIAIAKFFLKPLADFGFGLLAATADGGERIKLKLLINAISGKGVGHGGCLV